MGKGGAGGSGYSGATSGSYLANGASGGSAKPISYSAGGQYPMMNGMQGMPGSQGAGMQGIYFMITDGKQTYEGIVLPINLPYNGTGQMPGNTIDGKVNDYKADTRMALPPAGEMYDPLKDPKAQGNWLKQYLSSLGIGGGNGRTSYDAGGGSIDSKVKGTQAVDNKPSISEKYRVQRKEKEKAYVQEGQPKRSGQQAATRLEQTVERESLPLAV
jgi:hypothetical protein